MYLVVAETQLAAHVSNLTLFTFRRPSTDTCIHAHMHTLTHNPHCPRFGGAEEAVGSTATGRRPGEEEDDGVGGDLQECGKEGHSQRGTSILLPQLVTFTANLAIFLILLAVKLIQTHAHTPIHTPTHPHTHTHHTCTHTSFGQSC